ncbi:hypothetical protein PF008_g17044 [Phytophthora fragariae]|uniref:BZIP domain-containing protein n=1 Tax=Phytophthora fragariae TaxID=53985 RepID=A0A6G0RAA8_9STRA|nr:hypothetical protein PF008_g17044 [Phytophthora fragariae]
MTDHSFMPSRSESSRGRVAVPACACRREIRQRRLPPANASLHGRRWPWCWCWSNFGGRASTRTRQPFSRQLTSHQLIQFDSSILVRKRIRSLLPTLHRGQVRRSTQTHFQARADRCLIENFQLHFQSHVDRPPPSRVLGPDSTRTKQRAQHTDSMLMEHHHHTQGRPSWTPSLYSASSMAAPAATSTSLATPTGLSKRELALPVPAAAVPSRPRQQLPLPVQRHASPDVRAAAAAPARLSASPRGYAPAVSTAQPAPPMIGGSLSPHIRMGDKLSPVPAVVTPAFTIAKPGGLTTPKRATDEERRAKHREAQRRFVKRKKIEMTQLKQLAVELEKRHDLLQAVSEREALARENQALVEQLEAQKEKAQESPTSTNQPQVVVKLEEEKGETPVKEERPRTDIKGHSSAKLVKPS